MPAPPTRQGDDAEVLYGVTVRDPYRWLEDANSAETRAWVDAQNAYASSYLDTPERQAVREHVERAFDFERRSPPAVHAHVRWFRAQQGLDPQSRILRQIPGQPPEVLIDPNTLSADGTRALTQTSISPDGRFIAVGIADGGSDWTTWQVFDVAERRYLDDVITHTKFAGAQWLPDGAGFFYGGFPPTEDGHANVNMYIRRHLLGQPQPADLDLPLPEHPSDVVIWPHITEDGRYLIYIARPGAEHGRHVWLQRLQGADPHGPPVVLNADPHVAFEFVGARGPDLYFLTDLDAPRRRLVVLDAEQPQAPPREILPEGDNAIAQVRLAGSRLFCTRMQDCTLRATVHALDGTLLAEIGLPELGTVDGFIGDAQATEVFYAFRSFNVPPRIYRYDLATGESSLHFESQVHGVDVQSLQLEQIFVASTEGNQVPAFVLTRRDRDPAVPVPTVLYGYGGFNVSLVPEFFAAVAVWVQLGGAYVIANLRGGGEYGRAWHHAGIQQRKQNTFDDALAVAEHLVATGLTTSPQLAIHGKSNGGLLAGACLTQRPDLFGAAIPGVGVLDMLRYHRWTIGWAWASDYGTADDDEAMFRYLIGYSPVHNTRPRAYPPTLITTGDHDDRVVPAHSYKFAAALQAAQTGNAPIMLRVDTRAGHGLGKPTAKIIDEYADMWTFLRGVLVSE